MKLCERDQRPDILSSMPCCAEDGEVELGAGGSEIEIECQAKTLASNLASRVPEGAAMTVKCMQPDFPTR